MILYKITLLITPEIYAMLLFSKNIPFNLTKYRFIDPTTYGYKTLFKAIQNLSSLVFNAINLI